MTLCIFLVNVVAGSQGHTGHVGHIVFLLVNFVSVTFFSGSQGHAGHVGHVMFFWEKFVSGSQGHVDTQNWVTYVTRKTIVHRDTKLGHICDPGDFNNIGHNGTRVTGSRWSRGSRCVFFSENAFYRVTGTRHTRRSQLALFCPIMSHIYHNNIFLNRIESLLFLLS